MGVWNDLDDLFEDIVDSDMYTQHISGNFLSAKQYFKQKEEITWKQYMIRGELKSFKRKLLTNEHVFLTIICTDSLFVIAGDEDHCISLINELNPDEYFNIEHDIVCHCEALTPFKSVWEDIHTRDVKPISNIKFYSK